MLKKLNFILFIISFADVTAQTKLASHSLELKRPKGAQMIVNAVNSENHEVFVIASDKKTVNIHHYNSALFLVDTLSSVRPTDNQATIAGYSFTENGNPEIYWSTYDLAKIVAVTYPFNGGVMSIIPYELSFENEQVVTTFTQRNAFYIVTKPDAEEQLNFYVFQNGKLQEKIIDFSANEFIDEYNNKKKFGEILQRNPLQDIDTHALNPLFFGTAKSKMFVDNNKIVLTFDQNRDATQHFEIDLNDYSMTERTFLHAELSGSSKGNSYYHKGKLYQIKLHDMAMALSVTDVETGEMTRRYTVTESDTISFKNSPLLSQVGEQRPRELKSTKQFLNRLADSDVGVSAYQTPDYVLLSVGGIRYVQSTGNIIMSIAGGVGITLAAGGDFSAIEVLENEKLQSIYFEGLFNENFLHQEVPQRRLAADYLAQFLYEHENEISLDTVFRYRDYFILGYYDAKAKNYIMRKFEDDVDYLNRF